MNALPFAPKRVFGGNVFVRINWCVLDLIPSLFNIVDLRERSILHFVEERRRTGREHSENLRPVIGVIPTVNYR
jgi:hypothetical protein